MFSELFSQYQPKAQALFNQAERFERELLIKSLKIAKPAEIVKALTTQFNHGMTLLHAMLYMEISYHYKEVSKSKPPSLYANIWMHRTLRVLSGYSHDGNLDYVSCLLELILLGQQHESIKDALSIAINIADDHGNFPLYLCYCCQNKPFNGFVNLLEQAAFDKAVQQKTKYKDLLRFACLTEEMVKLTEIPMLIRSFYDGKITSQQVQQRLRQHRLLIIIRKVSVDILNKLLEDDPVLLFNLFEFREFLLSTIRQYFDWAQQNPDQLKPNFSLRQANSLIEIFQQCGNEFFTKFKRESLNRAIVTKFNHQVGHEILNENVLHIAIRGRLDLRFIYQLLGLGLFHRALYTKNSFERTALEAALYCHSERTNLGYNSEYNLDAFFTLLDLLLDAQFAQVWQYSHNQKQLKGSSDAITTFFHSGLNEESYDRFVTVLKQYLDPEIIPVVTKPAIDPATKPADSRMSDADYVNWIGTSIKNLEAHSYDLINYQDIRFIALRLQDIADGLTKDLHCYKQGKSKRKVSQAEQNFISDLERFVNRKKGCFFYRGYGQAFIQTYIQSKMSESEVPQILISPFMDSNELLHLLLAAKNLRLAITAMKTQQKDYQYFLNASFHHHPAIFFNYMLKVIKLRQSQAKLTSESSNYYLIDDTSYKRFCECILRLPRSGTEPWYTRLCEAAKVKPLVPSLATMVVAKIRFFHKTEPGRIDLEAIFFSDKFDDDTKLALMPETMRYAYNELINYIPMQEEDELDTDEKRYLPIERESSYINCFIIKIEPSEVLRIGNEGEIEIRLYEDWSKGKIKPPKEKYASIELFLEKYESYLDYQHHSLIPHEI